MTSLTHRQRMFNQGCGNFGQSTRGLTRRMRRQSHGAPPCIHHDTKVSGAADGGCRFGTHDGVPSGAIGTLPLIVDTPAVPRIGVTDTSWSPSTAPPPPPRGRLVRSRLQGPKQAHDELVPVRP